MSGAVSTPSNLIGFWKLNDLLMRLDDPSGELLIVARQESVRGSRIFLAINRRQFVESFQLNVTSSLYEVILEGASSKLFMDLEYVRALNPTFDLDRALHNVKESICVIMNQEFDLEVVFSDILTLTASSPEKVSYHLILDKPGTMSDNIFEVEKLVRKISSHCIENGQNLLINWYKGTRSFIDMGVYSNNQNFRIYYTEKTGSRRRLLVDKTDMKHIILSETADVKDRIDLHRLVLEASLVSGPRRLQSAGKITTENNQKLLKINNLAIEKKIESITELEESMLKIIGGAKIVTKKKIGDHISSYRIWPKPACITAGRVHRRNNTYVLVNSLDRSWRRHCLHPDCLTTTSVYESLM